VPRLRFLNQTWDGAGNRTGDRIIDLLSSNQPSFSKFFMSVAWVKETGLAHLLPHLDTFRKAGSKAIAVVGIDTAGTSIQGLEGLLNSCDEVWVFDNPRPEATFHPKMYSFIGSQEATVLLGSSNLTGGGLFTNYEATLEIQLNLKTKGDQGLLDTIMEAYTRPLGLARRLDTGLIGELRRRRLISDETLPKPRRGGGGPASRGETLFPPLPIPPPPSSPILGRRRLRRARKAPDVPVPTVSTFVMRLGGFDVSTAGGRSPDMLIPVRARDAAPGFWKWPSDFGGSSPTGPERYVEIRLILPPTPQRIMRARLYFYRQKSEFRFNCGAIRAAASEGDILQFEEKPQGSPWDYDVTLVRATDAAYESAMAVCTEAVPNSQKKWGFV
jgi:HKD family nuclease